MIPKCTQSYNIAGNGRQKVGVAAEKGGFDRTPSNPPPAYGPEGVIFSTFSFSNTIVVFVWARLFWRDSLVTSLYLAQKKSICMWVKGLIANEMLMRGMACKAIPVRPSPSTNQINGCLSPSSLPRSVDQTLSLC